MANPESLKKKIEQIKKDGVSHLHVVSDFDRTLTKAFVAGQKAHTGIAQIREGKYLTPEYPGKAHSLYDKYRPIEISETISLKEKIEKMNEWWSTHLKLLIESGMNEAVVDDIVKKKKIKFRPGVTELFKHLDSKQIPVLIFSAGIGNIIEKSMFAEGISMKNVHIISNFFDFDENGVAKGYKSGIVHTFNKNEGHIKKSPYFKQIETRKNVILLGDSLGDSEMLDGIEHKTIIRVGFLNEEIEKDKDKYEKEYDILILNDGSMDYVNELLKQIL